MNLIQLSVIKDGSTSYPTAQKRAIEGRMIKFAFAANAVLDLTIIDLALSGNKITVAGQKASNFLAGTLVTIKNSTGAAPLNNGVYTVKYDATYTGGNTVIALTKTLPSATISGTVTTDAGGTSIQYYDENSKALADLIVEEGMTDIKLNSQTLFTVTPSTIDGVAFSGGSALINSWNSLVALIPGATTSIKYNFGVQNHLSTKEIVVSETIAQIQAAIYTAESQTPNSTDPNYLIVDVNKTLNSFAVAGDHTDVFLTTTSITVVGGANAGVFTVNGNSIFDGTNTVIVVTQTITSGVIAGYIHLT